MAVHLLVLPCEDAGLEIIGLGPNPVPDLDDVTRRLEPLTGWRGVPVSGFIPARRFFESLAERRFPTFATVRPPEQLDYLPVSWLSRSMNCSTHWILPAEIRGDRSRGIGAAAVWVIPFTNHPD